FTALDICFPSEGQPATLAPAPVRCVAYSWRGSARRSLQHRINPPAPSATPCGVSWSMLLEHARTPSAGHPGATSPDGRNRSTRTRCPPEGLSPAHVTNTPPVPSRTSAPITEFWPSGRPLAGQPAAIVPLGSTCWMKLFTASPSNQPTYAPPIPSEMIVEPN